MYVFFDVHEFEASEMLEPWLQIIYCSSSSFPCCLSMCMQYVQTIHWQHRGAKETVVPDQSIQSSEAASQKIMYRHSSFHFLFVSFYYKGKYLCSIIMLNYSNNISTRWRYVFFCLLLWKFKWTER